MKRLPSAALVVALTLFALMPASAQKKATAANSSGDILPFKATEKTLANGLKLLIVEQHELPLADFVLLVGSGSTADPAGKPGIANLTAQMLREGTTTRKSLEIADQIAFLGISLSPNSSWESSTLSLHTPTAQLDSALALMAEARRRASVQYGVELEHEVVFLGHLELPPLQ